jgi:hypothetical protein
MAALADMAVKCGEGDPHPLGDVAHRQVSGAHQGPRRSDISRGEGRRPAALPFFYLIFQI